MWGERYQVHSYQTHSSPGCPPASSHGRSWTWFGLWYSNVYLLSLSLHCSVFFFVIWKSLYYIFIRYFIIHYIFIIVYYLSLYIFCNWFIYQTLYYIYLYLFINIYIFIYQLVNASPQSQLHEARNVCVSSLECCLAHVCVLSCSGMSDSLRSVKK